MRRNVWALRTVRKNFAYLREYLSYCNERYTEAPNICLMPAIAISIPRTKKHHRESNQSYIAYTKGETLQLLEAAKSKHDQIYADLIVIATYAGVRPGKNLWMKIFQVGEDRLHLDDSKTDSGVLKIPIHSKKQQTVSRMVTIGDDYFISGESSNNKYGSRRKGSRHWLNRFKKNLVL